MVIRWKDFLWERQFEQFLLKYGWEKVSDLECFLYTVKKGYSFLCMWMPLKIAGKKQHLDPMWRVLNKEVDLGDTKSFLDDVKTWDALNDNAK